VTLHLTVATGLGALADELATVLAHPATDPFAPEVVAVPGDGVRSWLTARLAERLGVVANVEFVFPARLVARALGTDRRDTGAWGVGPLTWAIHGVVAEHGEELGLPLDAVRCRAVADLFDRYALHRAPMVRAWEQGMDIDAVGADLPLAQRWQPRLWRHLLDRLGRPSAAGQLAGDVADLRAGRLQPVGLPDRVVLVGLTSLPPPHLEVLTALSVHRDVHLLVPVPSLTVWERVHEVARRGAERRVTVPPSSPVPRAEDPTLEAVIHPLGVTWGRAAREAMYLLARSAVAADAQVRVVEEPVDAAPRSTRLGRLRDDLRRDRADATVGDAATLGDAVVTGSEDVVDRTVEWHTTTGTAREAEVARDVVLRLLEASAADETPLEPRDVVLLCPDVARFAPAVEAAFAGDPDHGVPRIPLRVADRSLRLDAPLADAVAALLELLDGRFRVGDVLAFAERPPVRRRFAFDDDDLGRLATWLAETHVRWGFDGTDRARFGLPAELVANTWRAGLDQVLVGAAMAPVDDRLGPGGTAPHPDVEGDDLALAGRIAEYVHRLRSATEALTRPATVHGFVAALRAAIADLFELPDDEAWQRIDVEAILDGFAEDAAPAGVPHPVPVPHHELVRLLGARLQGRAGRARFGTGAVTLSSLTAQRGVPHRAIVLLGLDGDLGGAVPVSPEDLTAAAPCLGDRDPRAELRAQLLDAVLAATESLVLVTSGRDVRSDAAVPPAVPVAELLDVLDPSGSARDTFGRPHPRHAWSTANFLPPASGVDDGVWSFDRAALEAAAVRTAQTARRPWSEIRLPAETIDTVSVRELETTLADPAATLLRDRLGVWLDRPEERLDDLLPLRPDGLARWGLADSLVRARLRDPGSWDDERMAQWRARQRAAGSVAPGVLGDAPLRTAIDQAEVLFAALEALEPGALDHAARSVVVDLAASAPDGSVRSLSGTVGPVRGPRLVEIVASRRADHRLLAVWCRLLVLAVAEPGTAWEAVLVERADGDTPSASAQRLVVRSAAAAADALGVVLDLHEQARRTVVPFFPATGRALAADDRTGAAKAFGAAPGGGRGERDGVWWRHLAGEVDLAELLTVPHTAEQVGPGWPEQGGRMQRWAERVWGAVHASVEIHDGSAT
jgi:exodeoxyribonuclease V gamma subunit